MFGARTDTQRIACLTQPLGSGLTSSRMTGGPAGHENPIDRLRRHASGNWHLPVRQGWRNPCQGGCTGPLLDPVKIATLQGDRSANARLYRVIGWLETERRAGGDLTDVINETQATGGYVGTTIAVADRATSRWSRKKLEEFQLLHEAGVIQLRADPRRSSRARTLETSSPLPHSGSVDGS